MCTTMCNCSDQAQVCVMFNEHHVSVSIHVAHVRIYRIHVHVHEHLIRHTYAIRMGRICFRALIKNVNMGTLQDKNKTYMYNNTSLHTYCMCNNAIHVKLLSRRTLQIERGHSTFLGVQTHCNVRYSFHRLWFTVLISSLT